MAQNIATKDFVEQTPWPPIPLRTQFCVLVPLDAAVVAGTETENKIYARRSYGSNKKFRI